jgi:hypothetical protein
MNSTSSSQPLVPEISRFLRIVVAMYYRDRRPPHFHSVYGGFEITHRALAHVQGWRAVHRTELLDAWLLARTGQPLSRIEPLE